MDKILSLQNHLNPLFMPPNWQRQTLCSKPVSSFLNTFNHLLPNL